MAKSIQEALFEKGLVSQTQFLNSQNEKLLKEHSNFRTIEESGNPKERDSSKPQKREPVKSIYAAK